MLLEKKGMLKSQQITQNMLQGGSPEGRPEYHQRNLEHALTGFDGEQPKYRSRG